MLATTQKTVAGFAAALLILVVMGGIAYRTATSVVETNNLVTGTQGVLLLTDELRALIDAAEVALNDFSATRNPQVMDRYADVTARVGERLTLLDTLTSDRSEYGRRVTPLRAELALQLPRFRQEAEGGGDGAALAAAFRTFAGRVRSELQLIEREELSFLSTHSATEDVQARRTRQSIILGGLGAVGFFVLATLVIVGDLRGRHRAEEKLRISEQRFRTLADNAPVGIFLTDSKGRCELVNGQYTRITGLTAEEASGDGWQDRLHPEDREAIRHRWSTTALSGREGGRLEYRFVRPDGQIVWVFGWSAPLKDPKGHVNGFVGTIADITAQKLAEMERDRFFNLSLDLLAIGDLDGGPFRRLNPAWEQILGFSLRELMAVPFLSFVHPDDREWTQRQARSLHEGSERIRFENRCRRKDGSYRWLAWSAVADRDRKLTYATARDITEERHLEEELKNKNHELERQNVQVERATRLKSEFLANMSHELRTPLNGIIGFAELMRDGRAGPVSETHAEFLEDILTSSRHLVHLINDILDLSKVEAGKLEFRPEEVELERIITEVRNIVRELATKKRVDIEVSVHPDVKVVMLDPAKLKQVLYNYVSNALKFTENGRIIIRCQPQPGGRFRLEVEDTGIGIRDEDIGKLFAEFQQLDQGTAKKYQGTGLGLALTKRIVEAQGGSVGVSSRWGRGSIFHAVLPVRFQSQMKPEVPSVSLLTGAGDGPSILVIEDDNKDAEEIVRVLASKGFRPYLATTGTDAASQVRQQRFDGITLDLLLPDMNGWEVLVEIRESTLNENTPVVAVTVVSDDAASQSLAVQGFVSKPISEEKLIAALAGAGLKPEMGAPVGS